MAESSESKSFNRYPIPHHLQQWQNIITAISLSFHSSIHSSKYSKVSKCNTISAHILQGHNLIMIKLYLTNQFCSFLNLNFAQHIKIRKAKLHSSIYTSSSVHLAKIGIFLVIFSFFK